MASFSTVSLVHETPEVIARFARYYAAAGADEVLVYLDGPAPGLADLDLRGLTLIECDAAFWELSGGRPAVLEDRQHLVIQAGLARCRSDWLLVVDADELVFGDHALPDFLDAIPGGVDAVSLPTAEAVWGPGDDLDLPFCSTCFRIKWRSDRLWQALGRPIYGEAARYMRCGLIGHVTGKEFVRAGRAYSRIGNHAAERDGEVITRPAASIAPSLAGMFLGHYDAISLARWTEKWRRRIEGKTLAEWMSGPRTAQMELVAERLRRGDAATRALFAAFYGLTRPQYSALSLMGYAFRRGIFADTACAAPTRLSTKPTIS